MIVASNHASVYSALQEAASLFAERPLLRTPASSAAAYSDGDVEYSYAETLTRVDELRGGYAALGVNSGNRVAVAFDSRLEVYLHLLALNAIGASIVPLNSAATDSELMHIIGHSDSRFIVSLPEYVERMRCLGVDAGNCKALTETELTRTLGTISPTAASRSAEAALLYTSGTTGKPKGCMLSNDYFLELASWYVGLGDICTMDQNDRLLTPLPPNHMNALCTSFPAMMLCGGCHIQVDRFHPRNWWATVREENATIIHCLGVMTAILLTLPEDDSDDFSEQIKFCFGPGSDPRHQAVFEKRFGFPLIEAWAMTETGSGGMTIAYKEPRHVGQRCIGKPVNATDFRIVDSEDNDVATGEPGELLVRAKGDAPRKGFFSGYYKDSAATEAGWRGDWWHTGDVVKADSDGSLYFVDRIKNVIRRSGENIAAVEVEAVLLQHDSVDGCAVCAVPDEIRGDEVFAFIVCNTSVAGEDLFNHCYKHLTYFKVPGYIAFVDSLPLTASQKVSRGDIKQMARDCIAASEALDLRKLKKRQR